MAIATKASSPIRADIQALRALAVGLVIINHLWPKNMSGGFIGVDIFFVISGYLITAHLRREADRTGRLNLAAFWARRAKRLLPAALTVLAFSFIATVLWIPISSRESAFGQIGAAGSYFLNWLLASSSLNYFAQGNAESPVTHYWSLSVEEQFYIVWPILIAVCLWLVRRRSTRTRDTVILGLFAAIFVASFAWANYSVETQPSAAYFETTGRAWEFAAGGLLAFAPRLSSSVAKSVAALPWLAWLGLAYTAFTFDGDSGFPGSAALVPVLLTCAIIWIGDSSSEWSPSGLTGLGPIQFLGSISYSAYLWHWPLIVVAPFIVHRDIYAKDKLVILVITLVLAYLSKRFIEDPVRTSSFWLVSRPHRTLIVTVASVVALLLITSAASNQMVTRARDAVSALTALSSDADSCFGAQASLSGSNCPDSHTLADNDYLLLSWENQNTPLANGTSCQQDRGRTEVLSCSFGVVEGTQTTDVAVIGDSHASMWARTLSEVSDELGLRMHTYFASSCAATLDPGVVFSLLGTQHEECREWREAAIHQITADPTIDVVVTSSYDGAYLGAADSTGKRVLDSGDGYVAAWNEWLNAGKRVIVINEIPERDELIPDCIAASGTRVDPCTIDSAVTYKPGPLEVAAAQIEHDNFEFVDYTDVFCDENLCHSVVGGIPVYLDSNHLTAPFARSFANAFFELEMLPNPTGRG